MSEDTQDSVRGEREQSAVIRAMSVQSRVSNILAIGLMSALGLGSLAWYYANTITRNSRAREHAETASSSRAQGDAPLPGLGRFEAPLLRDPPAPLAPSTLSEVPLAVASPISSPGMAPPKTPAQVAQERALAGAVFASQAAGGLSSAAAASKLNTASMSEAPVSAPSAPNDKDAGGLTALLRSDATPAVKAMVLPARRLLLPKGAFIDCTLETAIDSTLPGMTTCIMATDTFGVDGKVVLMERGTKLIGETRGQVQQGTARIFVLWTEARTPAGVIVPLDSPGADELGRAGLTGDVSTHFWARFGAAMLVSVINGAIEAAVQSRGNGNTVVLNPSASQDILTEVLKHTIAVPPTIVKHNGDRIQVLVARDLDFRSVYELRSTAPRH